MNKKLTLLGILLGLLVAQAYSQSSRIYGKVENANAYVIRLKAYSDFLSMTEETLDSCVISDDGSFELKVELQETKLHVLVIGFQKAFIYLQPGREYQLAVSYDRQREQITFVNKAQLEFQFVGLPTNDLNRQIAGINLKVNDFLVSNFDQIYKRRNKKVIEEFSKKLKESFKNASGFLKSYIDLRLASIEYSSGLKTKTEIFETILKDKNILYNNDEYFMFFREFFDKYLLKPNPYFEIQNLRNQLFGSAKLSSILSILNADPVLQNREMKELVLLKGLYELYSYPSTNKTTVLKLIYEIGQQTLFREIAKVASSLHASLTYLQPGTDFPKGFLSGLSNPVQKATFVSFFTLPCIDCMREMDSIASMYKKYSDDVQFISIALNTSGEALNKFRTVKNYPWKIIQSEHSFELAETYQIKSLPAYFLVDSKSKILMNPALQPWQGFSSAFRSVFNY